MSLESLKKLYDDLYQSKSPAKENQETKEVQEIRESEYIKIPSPEVDPITKPVPIDFPRVQSLSELQMHTNYFPKKKFYTMFISKTRKIK